MVDEVKLKCSMECTTKWGKPKRKYDTLDEAIEACKKLNSNEKRIHKLVSYKCSICFKYHIGSNGKLLKHKEDIYDYKRIQ